MKENIPLLNFIRSNRFILYVAIFTVIFLAPNTYYVFYQLSVFIPPYREIVSGAVALIVAASIMIYTLRRNFKVAKYYSLFEMLISGYYYIDMLGWDWRLIPAFGFTFMLPISVFHYTKEIDVEVKPEKIVIEVDHDEDLERWLNANPDKLPVDYYKQKN
jgi:hypothetical protein